MEYDAQSDIYTCQNGKKLTVDHIRHSKCKTGYVSEKTIYKCEDCSECPYKKDCIKGNHCKISLEERTKSIQAEDSFGDIKQDMKFRRYLSKGTSNVLAESILLAMARNINKLHNKLQKGRTAPLFYGLKSIGALRIWKHKSN